MIGIEKVAILYKIDEKSPLSKDWIDTFSIVLGSLLNRLVDGFEGIELIDSEEKLSTEYQYLAGLVIMDSSLEYSDNFLKTVSELEFAYKSLVLVDKPDYSQMPEILTDLPVFHVPFQEIEKNQRLRAENFMLDTIQLLWPKLFDIAYSIYSNTQLVEFKDLRRLNVFLAECSSDQEANRDSIRRELLHFGYHVVPDRPLPKDKTELKRILDLYYKITDLSIHIFGEEYGDLLSDGEGSTVNYQNKIASLFCKENEGFPRFIWLSPDLRLMDEKQKARIDQLRINSELLRN